MQVAQSSETKPARKPKREKQTYFNVECGGVIVGTIHHEGPRRFSFSLFFDEPGKTRYCRHGSRKHAERAMMTEWMASLVQKGERSAESRLTLTAERNTRDLQARHAELHQAELALEERERALAANALKEATIVELAHAIENEWEYAENKQQLTAAEILWRNSKAYLESEITEDELRRMCKDSGIDLADDDHVREAIREEMINEVWTSPLVSELIHAYHATDTASREYAIKRAFFEMKLEGLI